MRMEPYSIKDLRRIGANEFRQVGTGNFTHNRAGRRVEITEGVEFFPTKIGKIESTKWYRFMEDAVRRENMQELLDRIEKVCNRLAWLKTDQDRHEYALEVLSSEAYLHWPEWTGEGDFYFHFRFDDENSDR